MKEYKHLLANDLSPQVLMQAFTHIQWLQFAGERIPEDLVQSLTHTIERFGGLGEIDKWLGKNDPGHSTPSSFQIMDWSWLREDLRMPKP